MKRTYTMQVTRTVDFKDISDLLCNAFEGGSNYWYQIEDYVEPEKIWQADESKHDVFAHLQYPLSEGGAVILSDMEGDDESARYTLDLASVERGLQAMAEKYPGHFGEWLQGQADSTTGDVFLQCCVFGEAIYG